jgi:hypothetical protein
MWSLRDRTIRRIFEDEPGVVYWGNVVSRRSVVTKRFESRKLFSGVSTSDSKIPTKSNRPELTLSD